MSPAPCQPAPTRKVETSALPAPSYGGGGGIGTYQPPARPEVTGSVQTSSYPRQPAPAPQNWSWDGGTAIVVAQGETIDTDFAAPWRAGRRDPAGQQHDAGRPDPARPAPGHPARAASDGGRAAGVAARRPASRVRPNRMRRNGTHVVAPGETIYSLARHYHLTPMAIAKANNVGLDHHVKVGDRIVIPGGAGAPRIAMPAPRRAAAAARAARQPASKPARQAREPRRKAAQPSRAAEGRPGRSASDRAYRRTRGRSAARADADRHHRRR